MVKRGNSFGKKRDVVWCGQFAIERHADLPITERTKSELEKSN